MSRELAHNAWTEIEHPADAQLDDWFACSMRAWMCERRIDVRIHLMFEHLDRCQSHIDELRTHVDWL